MSLPLVPIPERLSPDDVLSYQHVQQLVDKANDADDLFLFQHRGGIGLTAGEHMAMEAPLELATLIIRPPRVGLGDDPNTCTPLVVAGYVDADSISWMEETPDESTTPAVPYYYFRFTTPGDAYQIKAAEVQSSFAAVPSANVSGSGVSNMLMIHPCITVFQETAGRSGVELYFGRGSSSFPSSFLAGLLQFTVTVYGIPKARP